MAKCIRLRGDLETGAKNGEAVHGLGGIRLLW